MFEIYFIMNNLNRIQNSSQKVNPHVLSALQGNFLFILVKISIFKKQMLY